MSSSFLFPASKLTKENHAILTELLGEYALSHATVKDWVVQFKRGDFSPVMRPVLDDPKQ